MTSEGLREMFEGDFGGMCAEKLTLTSMGRLSGCQACADMGGEINLHTEILLTRLPRTGRFMVGGKKQHSIEIMASLAFSSS